MIFGRLGRVVAIAGTLVGCGGSYGTNPLPSPSPSPSPSPTTTVLETRSFDLSARSALPVSVDRVAPGLVEARLDWGSSANDLNLYVTDTNCSSILDLTGGRCRVLAQSAATSRPETARFTGTATADYVVWSHNLGPDAERAQLQVTITR